jgi:1D-myo-inositol 3-kinase
MYQMTVGATTPELLVLGHVTRDLIGPHKRLGGAGAFSSRAGACLGARVALVTGAPKYFPLLRPILHDPSIELVRVPCSRETTFSQDHDASGLRRLHVLHRAAPLLAEHVPAHCRGASVTYVGPVVDECPAALLSVLTSPTIVVGAQGWLRQLGEDDGLVLPGIAPEMQDPPRGIRAMVFSELDHPDAEGLAQHVAGRGIAVAVTRGRAGATLWTGDGREQVRIPAFPAVEVESTGAGDVFGVVFALSLSRGLDLVAAARQGARAAARAVEGPGLGNLGMEPLGVVSGVA